MAKKEIEIGQRCAFINENALVLYFDKAETPFVARYDLDSLAQANFEVTDKKDGLFTLSLRDYAGRSQDVGQFSNKADAHQALYTILQALLEHKGQNGTCTIKPFSLCGIGCGLLKLLKWVLIVIGVLVVLYVLTGLIPVSSNVLTGADMASVSVAPDHAAAMTSNQASSGVATGLSALPEGEAVDADALFSGMATTDAAVSADIADTETTQDEPADKTQE